MLQPGDFYRQHHGTIYAAVLELYERREPVDIVTVSEVLERQGKLTVREQQTLALYTEI